MIRSPIIRIGAARGRGCRCGGGARGRCGGARRFARRRGRSGAGADRLLDEFELVHRHGDVVLTHTQEAADTNNHGVDLAVLI